jgi:hypothetical protein
LPSGWWSLRRLADDDAPQNRGEIVVKGQHIAVPNGNGKPTAKDIGLTRKQIDEARAVRDAEKDDPVNPSRKDHHWGRRNLKRDQ